MHTVWVLSWSVKAKLYKVAGVDLVRPHWYLGKQTVSSKSIISFWFPICLAIRGKSASILFWSSFSTFRQTLQGKLHPSAEKIKGRWFIAKEIMKLLILIFQLYLSVLALAVQNYDQSKPMICVCSKWSALLFNDVPYAQ